MSLALLVARHDEWVVVELREATRAGDVARVMRLLDMLRLFLQDIATSV